MTAPTIILIIVAIAAAAVVFFYQRSRSGHASVPNPLRRNQPLPEFSAIDENGNQLSSSELNGQATIMLFVRGNWCPFCSAQVEDLVVHYKVIDELGARLILVTPKPLETTRRVADFFNVNFDFWLDADLSASRQLGLLHSSGVPGDYRREYGSNTLWPMALVIDSNGIIRYAEKSKKLSDRPDPKLLLDELRIAMRV